MTKHALREMVLICVAEQFEEARAQPEPAGWRVWEHEPWEIAQKVGPPYSTIRWFGQLAQNEAGRMRCLRMVRALEGEGLLECIKDEFSGKLSRVRLTARGWEVVQTLRSASKTLQADAEEARNAEERASLEHLGATRLTREPA
jgi:hypothetical protein